MAQRNFTMFRFHDVFHIGLQFFKAIIIDRYIHYENYKHKHLLFNVSGILTEFVLLFVLTFFSLLFILLFFFLTFFSGGGGGMWVGWRSKGKRDSGTPWVVSTSELLPDILQREMNNWGWGGGGGGATIHHYSSLYISKANLTSRSECDFQTLIDIYNLMKGSFKLYSASYRIGTFIY